MSTAVLLPAEVETRIRRRDAATVYRCAIESDPARDGMWTAYRHGAEWFGVDWQTGADRRAIRLGLDDAERAVPFDRSP